MVRDPFQIDDAFRKYIKARLLPRLGLSIIECTLEMPLIGRKSCLRILKSRSGEGYVIRAFPANQQAKIEQIRCAFELLNRHGIPAPALVDHAERFSQDITFLTEAYLEGTLWRDQPLTEELARKLAGLLAQLHRVQSDGWGSITRRNRPRGSFGRRQFKRVQTRLERIRRFSPNANRADFRALAAWFRTFQEALDARDRFDLTHEDIRPGNILYHEGGEVRLLDFATLRFGCRVKDLVDAECSLLRNQRERIEAFREVYFASFPDTVRAQFESVRDFYRGFYYLSRSDSIMRYYLKRKGGFPQAFHEEFRQHWNAVWTVMEGGDVRLKVDKDPRPVDVHTPSSPSG